MTAASPLEIQIWPIDRLILYARNPRKNDAVVDRMCSSIREFGFKIPVLARSDGEVVDGHLRIKAAKKLRLEHLPVILCDEWSPAQVKAFRLMVNRSVNWASWDDELLALELQELSEADFDLSLTGFDDAELAGLLVAQSAIEGLTDEDAVPPVPETPISAHGDLWVLGTHKLLVGDATDSSAICRLMASAAADLVFTDPRGLRGLYRGETHHPGRPDGAGAVSLFPGNYVCQLPSNREARCIAVCLSSVFFPARVPECFGGGWVRDSCQVIWAKNTFAWGFGRYKFRHEPIFYAHVAGQSDPWYGDKSQSTLWEENKPAANRLHPTMKPVELVERAFVNSSKSGDLVVDFFGGSGTTLIACERRSRTARLMELDPRYADVIVRRWQDYTGKKATLEGDGRTFDQVAIERRER